MKYETATILLAFLGLATAAPVQKPRSLIIPRHILRAREVPQEHSHEKFLTSVRASLNTNNPDGIVDPVFGLLGNAAAAGGLGKLTDTECLQQSTADQAFTNAKVAGDITGMINALAYRALERNTGKVGLRSNSCTSVTAVNSEIAAISQHQDPASSGAAATNKAIVLELAKQIAAIGGNASVATDTGTFAPGSLSDNTGKGNTCDTQNDPVGCIFTQNFLIPDATEDEIAATIAGVSTSSGAASISKTAASNTAAPPLPVSSAATVITTGCTPSTTTITMMMTEAAGAAAASSTAAVAASGTNIQTFTGTLGGAPPPVISSTGDRPFSVNGDTFVNSGAALQRSCSIQHNACADDANSGKLLGGVGQCDTQENACNASISSKVKRAALDFGSCSNPSILFEFGLDGRTQEAFIAANQADFNHGSALNIGVIASFICQRLGSPCNAAADAITACSAGEAAAAAKTGQAAADAFNAALGVSGASSTAATAAATSTTTAVVVASTTAAAAGEVCPAISTITVMMSMTVASEAATTAAAATTTTAAAATFAAASTTAAASGTNVQKFTGALGGIGAPPVIQTSGDRPFSTDNATFVNAAAALQRSCSVQHNQCANAANAGTLAGGEAQCETQENACNAFNNV